MTDTRDGEYDDLLDAIADGEAYYVACANDHGWLPPRRVCPECGSRELREESLPQSGEIETYTIVTVPTPQFEDDAPYVTAIVTFGPVSITGQVRGVDPEAVATGDRVELGVGETETTGDRLLVFEPR